MDKADLLGLAARIITILEDFDEDGSMRPVIYRVEALFANEYGLPPDEVSHHRETIQPKPDRLIDCFVCGAEAAESRAVKMELGAGISGHLCPDCDQIRREGRSESRSYDDLSDEEKSLLKLFQQK